MTRRFATWGRRLLLLGFFVFAILPFCLVLIYRVAPVPLTPLMGIRWVEEGYGVTHDWVPLEEISDTLYLAIVASEDNRFCQHHGIDWSAIDEAMAEVREGRRKEPRGASTLSQQTAKNLLLWPNRSILRKGLELTYVTWLEALWPKRRILEVYVNSVEWGPGIYGAEAASRHYFDKSARQLTTREAALLAVSLPAPLIRNPGKPSGLLNGLARRVEGRIPDVRRWATCLP